MYICTQLMYCTWPVLLYWGSLCTRLLQLQISDSFFPSHNHPENIDQYAICQFIWPVVISMNMDENWDHTVINDHTLLCVIIQCSIAWKHTLTMCDYWLKGINDQTLIISDFIKLTTWMITDKDWNSNYVAHGDNYFKGKTLIIGPAWFSDQIG